MTLSTLLGALFSKRSKNTVDRASDGVGDAASASAQPQIASEIAGTGAIDNSVRMHIAAHDPAFPAKRAAALDSIIAAIDAVALAHGFTKKAKSWAKTGELGTVSIHLQRSPYGFDCHIDLGFQPLNDQAGGPWAQDDFVALDQFIGAADPGAGASGTLIYLDVHDDVENLENTMQVLSEQALPWLSAHLTDPSAHNQSMRPDQRDES